MTIICPLSLSTPPPPLPSKSKGMLGCLAIVLHHYCKWQPGQIFTYIYRGILLYALTPASEKIVILGTSVHDMTQCNINKQQQQKNNTRINIWLVAMAVTGSQLFAFFLGWPVWGIWQGRPGAGESQNGEQGDIQKAVHTCRQYGLFLSQKL